MKKRRTPQEKKKLSLEKDHPLQAKYPHAFRKSWRKKRRHAEKSARNKLRQEVEQIRGEVSKDLLDDLDTNNHRRVEIRKWDSLSLGEVIKHKEARRIGSYQRKQRNRVQRAVIQLFIKENQDIGACSSQLVESDENQLVLRLTYNLEGKIQEYTVLLYCQKKGRDWYIVKQDYQGHTP